MLTPVIEFLRCIGLMVVIEPGATGFAKGVRIVAGALHVDPQCNPSTLLHEAGHIAITPGRFRSYMDGDLRFGQRRMIAEVGTMALEPDHPLDVAVMQCSDQEVTAWAWAAGLAIGLTPGEIIMDHEYRGAGADIRTMLQMNEYAGIKGMRRAGMCLHGYTVPPAMRYPTMQRWLQSH